MSKVLPRRAFLRGTGSTMIALPFLEVMRPALARAQTTAPIRVCFSMYPYGSYLNNGAARSQGSSHAAPAAYGNSFSSLMGDITFVNNLISRAKAGDKGPHHQAQATYLGQAAAERYDVRAGKSADQYIADTVRGKVTIPAFTVANPEPSKSAEGYSAEYHKISWETATKPAPVIDDAGAAFDKLFKNFEPGTAPPPLSTTNRRLRLKMSVLDEALGDAKRLNARVSKADRIKLDQYLTSIRQVEQAIERTLEHEEEGQGGGEPLCDPGSKPSGNGYDKRTRALFELIRLGFQCDQTRVSTFFLGTTSFEFWGVSRDHHSVSHWGSSKGTHPQDLTKINSYYGTVWSEFVQNVKHTDDMDGHSLLDNCILTFGSAMEDGDDHSLENLSVAVAGRAGGAYTPGRLLTGHHIPLANLWLTIMQTMGANQGSLGSGSATSTGTLSL